MWKKFQLTILLMIITASVSSAFTAAALVWYYLKYEQPRLTTSVAASRQSDLAEEFSAEVELQAENTPAVPDPEQSLKRHSRQALTESVIRAIAAGDFVAVRCALSPDSRLRLDAFLKQKNRSGDEWLKELQELWKKRLKVTDLEAALTDRALYDQWEQFMMKRSDEEYELLDNQWYMLFKPKKH